MRYLEFDLPEKFKDEPIENFESKKAKEFFIWFISMKDERIKMLEDLVKNTAGFENWQANYKSESLNNLQRWFEPQIEERTLTDNEIAFYHKGLDGSPFEEDIKNDPKPVWTFSGKTIRLSVDLGIYFSEVFLKNNKSLYWGQNTRSKFYIYRNYPLVMGFKGVNFTPFFIVRNLTQSYLKGDKFTWKEVYEEKLQYIKHEK